MSNAIAIIRPEVKRKIEELSKNHKIFESNFVFKSLRIKIELEKEKMRRNMHKNKAPILPYSYIQRKSVENLNLSTKCFVQQLSRNKAGVTIASF